MIKIFLILSLLGSFNAFAQEDPAAPSEEDLLDFDALDKEEGGDDSVQLEPAKEAPPPAATPAPVVEAVPTPEVKQAVAPTPEPAIDEPPPPELTEEPPPPPEPEPIPAPEPPKENPVAEIPAGGEDADRQREERYARIFKNFNSQQISDVEWASIAGEKSSERYAIQSGDTLWEVSKVLFGSGFYWPKVWQLNDSITNPHIIEVGNSLKFTPGNLTKAPSLSVDESVQEFSAPPEEEIDEIELPPVAEGQPNEKVRIPPPLRRTPLLKKFPSSIVEQGYMGGNYDESGFSMDKEIRVKVDTKNFITPVTSILTDDDWVEAGEVVEMEGDSTVASTFQNIILEMEEAPKSGDYFTVYIDNGKVSDPVSGSTVGIEIQTKAEVMILEPVEGADEMYRAVVKNCALPVKIGDKVTPGRKIVRTNLTVDNKVSPIAARIVDGEFNDRRVFSLYAAVFLNRGSEEGLRVGTLLNVVKNMKRRNPNSVVSVDPKPIGILKVAHVSAHVATAIIVAQRDAIIPGDETTLEAANTLFRYDLETGGSFSEPTAPEGQALTETQDELKGETDAPELSEPDAPSEPPSPEAPELDTSDVPELEDVPQ